MIRLAPALVASGLLAATSACNGGDAPSADSRASLEGRQQAATLRLPAGRSTSRFRIIALRPRTHTFDVRVVAPTEADIAVGMRTQYGRALNVLGSSKDSTRCDIGPARSICLLRFPALEGQRAGRWTVLVFKRSHPPAEVRVEVTFRRV